MSSRCIPKLDLQTLGVIPYSDAAFANNIELSSQLEQIVKFTNISNKSYQTHMDNINRDTLHALGYQSTFSACSDLSYDQLETRKQLKLILKYAVLFHIFSDSNSLFDIICKES